MEKAFIRALFLTFRKPEKLTFLSENLATIDATGMSYIHIPKRFGRHNVAIEL